MKTKLEILLDEIERLPPPVRIGFSAAILLVALTILAAASRVSWGIFKFAWGIQ